MSEITAREWALKDILSDKHSVDYYQREYAWATKQVQELLDDLSSRFLRSFDPSHDRQDVARYGPYFLGSIVVSKRPEGNFIVDGQQRLTTLTLLLLFLYRHDDLSTEDKANVGPLILSTQYGHRSFNLSVEEREGLLNALYEGEEFDSDGSSEAVINMAARYQDIAELFPEELEGETLPYFVDWLIGRVFIARIIATDDEDAYTIFETMNDRGLPLNPVDMLKGYLLANIRHTTKRNSLNEAWRRQMQGMAELYREAEQDFLKAWLRGQYARTIRASMQNAEPGDYDRIGSEFHRWVREVGPAPKPGEGERVSLGLNSSSDFETWMRDDFSFFGRQFTTFHDQSFSLKLGSENTYYNAQANLTMQPMVALAAIRRGDSEEVIAKKWQLVTLALDIYLTRRIWAGQSVAQRTIKYNMFEWTKQVRNETLENLVGILSDLLEEGAIDFEPSFALHGQNRRSIHRILARITSWVETESGMNNKYVEYTTGTGRAAYEVEHVWANKPDRHTDEFSSASDFREYRNRIGGLLILPKSFNASYGDLAYGQKLPHYDSHNLLARSLGSPAYDRNPGFLQFLNRSGLAFRAHDEFRRRDLDARGELISAIAKQIWSPDRLGEANI